MIFVKKAIWLIIIFSTMLSCMSACTNNSAKMPDDFNFSINFGIGAKNCIDTYNDTFTKDLIIDGTETIEFVIPMGKMQEIYEAFGEYKISELPDDINAQASIGDVVRHRTPANEYSLTYTCNKETRTIICDDGGPWDSYEGPPDTRDRLANFVNIIREYIYSTEEYQNMSQAEGGYQ